MGTSSYRGSNQRDAQLGNGTEEMVPWFQDSYILRVAEREKIKASGKLTRIQTQAVMKPQPTMHSLIYDLCILV